MSIAVACSEALSQIYRLDGVVLPADEEREKWTHEEWLEAEKRQHRAYDLIYGMMCLRDGLPSLPVFTREGPHLTPERIDPWCLSCKGWHNHASIGSGEVLSFSDSKMHNFDGWPLFV